MMYILPPERQHVLNTLFNSRVRDVLRQHLAPISEALREEYHFQINKCYHAYDTTRPIIWLKKDRPNLPYSVLLVNDEPFLVLPAPAEWKLKPHSNAAPKTLISLTTGELKFLKVYRPINETDPYPKASSAKDLENRKKWGESTDIHCRKSKNGIKYYLLMPHYGKSFEKFDKDSNITPRHILSALIQAALHVKKWHERGILHLDLKPSNMVYDEAKDTARLIDFETMVPDQTVVTIARGTIPFMHPDRLIYVSPSRIIRRSGNITCTKADDIFSLLRTMQEMLIVAEAKEVRPAQKTMLRATLTQCLQHMYQGTNPNGSRVAKPLCQMPTIETLIGILKQTTSQYEQIPATPSLPKVALPHFVPLYQAMPKLPSPRLNPTGIPFSYKYLSHYSVMPSPRMEPQVQRFVHQAPHVGSNRPK